MSVPVAPLAFHDLAPELDDFRADVLQGLAKPRKEIPPKYFYDERGSLLFDRICDLEEYYLTRTEIGLLRRYQSELADAIGPDCLLIEYGSGSSRKAPILLIALPRLHAYIPIDISKEHLLRSSTQLAVRQPGLVVIAVCADYTRLTQLPQVMKYQSAKKVIFFPGSSIGNYNPMQAILLLKTAAGLVGEGGGMLIGVDLKKDRDVLHAAYNDSQGVTAAFNLNILWRLRHELRARVEPAHFRHDAFYNEQSGRIEMHLVSTRDQTIELEDDVFRLAEGEGIHTENSYKYTVEEFRSMAEVAGFKPEHVWRDAQNLFSLHYLTAG
jgi:dimethylhistidine N-methyltransferase